MNRFKKPEKRIGSFIVGMQVISSRIACEKNYTAPIKPKSKPGHYSKHPFEQNDALVGLIANFREIVNKCKFLVNYLV